MNRPVKFYPNMQASGLVQVTYQVGWGMHEPLLCTHIIGPVTNWLTLVKDNPCHPNLVEGRNIKH